MYGFIKIVFWRKHFIGKGKKTIKLLSYFSEYRWSVFLSPSEIVLNSPVSVILMQVLFSVELVEWISYASCCLVLFTAVIELPLYMLQTGYSEYIPVLVSLRLLVCGVAVRLYISMIVGSSSRMIFSGLDPPS